MSDNQFRSPTGNVEVWAEKPIGYFTEEEWISIHKDEIEQAAILAEEVAAKAEAAQILSAYGQKIMAQTENFSVDEFRVFALAGLFEEWAAGVEYASGQRLVHVGIVYEVKQDIVSQEHQPPDSEGMLAVYRPLSADPESGDEEAGTLAEPIAFIEGLDVFEGKYYFHDGRTYLAKTDMPACIWPPDSPGMWQWEGLDG